MKKMLSGVLAAFMIFAGSAQAQNSDGFVWDNLLSVLYHELGHAIIDQLRLPLFGQEEDAADVASVLLVHALFEEEAAVEIIYAAAFGFLGEAEVNGEPNWADTHGPDLQRYFNMVCIFVGADMDERIDIGEELGLPEERLEWCEEEFTVANDSWGAAFDELAEKAPAQTIVYEGGTTTPTEKLVSEEVVALNEDFAFPNRLVIAVEECDEPNAFYDPQEIKITMCSEFEDWLRKLPNDG
jgi:hypothetical protein